jgi:tetratricopeptide (TPR) repeat protein
LAVNVGHLRAPRFGAQGLAALVVVLLAVPSNAFAQRDAFYSTLLTFYKTLSGVYGDEGPQLTVQLDALAAALKQWDQDVLAAEATLRPRLDKGDAQTRLQVHTLLASLYIDRGRFDDALREFDEDLRIDAQRAVFHRYQGLIHQAQGRPAPAADAFHATWLLEPADPQNAYRLIAFRSALTTPAETDRALAALATVERELIAGQRPRATAPFTSLAGIVDDAGGGMAFVPAAYARGFTLVSKGEFDAGAAALRAALAADPLVIDAASNAETSRRGAAALRQGLVADATSGFTSTVAAFPASSEAHRLLGTVYGVAGDITRSLQSLREAVRLNPANERSWHQLLRTLDESTVPADTAAEVRAAIASLPDAGALRWQLALLVAKGQRTTADDLAMMTAIDRYVVLVGRGELLLSLARLAQVHLDYGGAISLLERAVALIPNNADAHRILASAFIDDGRDSTGYAELVIALLLNPDDGETLTLLGRVHAAAGRTAESIAALRRAVALDSVNPQAVLSLGDALVRAEQPAEGRQWLQEAEKYRARSLAEDRLQRTIATLTLQAEVSMTERDYATAIDRWDQIAQLRPKSALSQRRLADASVAAGRLDEAARAYQAAVSLGAGTDTRRRLADVYEALGRKTESEGERAGYVQQRLEELRQRAAEGPSR